MRTKVRNLDAALAVVISAVKSVIDSKMLKNDRFKLIDSDLGQEGRAEPNALNSKNTEKCPWYTLRLANGRKMVIPPYQILNGRMLNAGFAIPTNASTLPNTKHCFVGRALSQSVTDNSEPLWQYYGLEEGKEFYFPSKLKVVGALISCDTDDKPMPSLFCYKGYSDFLKYQHENNLSAKTELFKVALATTGKDRLACLPKGVNKMEILEHLEGKLEPSNYNFTLIFEDIED